MSNCPQLQRRVEAITGIPVGTAIGPGTESTPIEVSAGSTGKRRKTSGAAGLVEITVAGTKALVDSIDKIRDSTQAVEDKRSKT
jgi:hypothetical protein